MSGDEALKRAGLTAIELEAKEGGTYETAHKLWQPSAPNL